MAKILLVDLVVVNSEINEPINLLTLAAYLKQHSLNHTIKFASNLDSDFDKLCFSGFDLVGISSKVKTKDILFNLLSKIETYSIPTVIGNAQGANYKEILARFPDVICVRSEGEEPLRFIAACIDKYGKLDISTINQISNTALIRNDRIEVNSVKPLNLKNYPIINRSKLPSLQSINSEDVVYRIEGSRGCTWNRCRFCSIPEKQYNQYRQFSLSKIVSESELAYAQGIRRLYFTDEDFVGDDPERIGQLADMIIFSKNNNNMGQDLQFSISMKVPDVIKCHNKSILCKLTEAGFIELFVGLESGSQSQIKRYRKPATVETNIKAIEILKSYSFSIDIGFIPFDPIVTLDELTHNYNFIKSYLLTTTTARVIKKLLLTKRCKYLEDYKNKIHLIEPSNSDFIGYNFSNTNIQLIYDQFQKYEARFYTHVDKLQQRIRYNNKDEEAKSLLLKNRQHDFRVFGDLLSQGKEGRALKAGDMESLSIEKEQLLRT